MSELEHPVVKYLKEKPINMDKLEGIVGIPKGTCFRLVANNSLRSKYFVTLEEYFNNGMKY